MMLYIILVVLLDVVNCSEVEQAVFPIGISWVTGIVSGAILLVLIVILALCGGCTPMEVGSEDHAASGGRHPGVNYSSVCTDANTRVLTAGTTLPNDPYQPQTQHLPYPLHPQTENNFTGYQSQGQTGYQGQGQGIPQQGFQAAGAHRHFSEAEEAPPPAYNEAVHASAPPSQPQAQAPYGW